MISTAINASWEFRRAASELWQKGCLQLMRVIVIVTTLKI
jgi:hypothetical protein